MYLEGDLQLVGRLVLHEPLGAEDDDEVGNEGRADLLDGGQGGFTVDIAREVVRNGGQRDVSKDEIREGRHGERACVTRSKGTRDVVQEKIPPEISNDSASALLACRLPRASTPLAHVRSIIRDDRPPSPACSRTSRADDWLRA